MGDDDEGAHGRGEVVVRVFAVVGVLGEILRLHELADVVEIRAHAADRGIRADGFGGGLGEVRDGEAVVVGAGGFHAQAFEHGVVEVGHLQPGNVGRDFEKMLNDRE